MAPFRAIFTLSFLAKLDRIQVEWRGISGSKVNPMYHATSGCDGRNDSGKLKPIQAVSQLPACAQ
jgi:hypothetical protein